jgi:pilus assembly protein FimV
MTPTPPSPEDDILDLVGLGLEPKKPKASTPESDFEKELEALFAEDLTEPVVKSPVASNAAIEDVLSLDDLVPEPASASAPAPTPDSAPDEVLDLGAFAAEPAPAEPASAEADDDVLDLGAFATGGELDITPPDETIGGKDGGIDTDALDDLISGLGETKEPEPLEDNRPHDDTDMSDLLESLHVPAAQAVAAPAADEPADELLELSLGDLVEDMPVVELQPEPQAALAPELPDLDISLPDLSDPEPQAAEPEPMALADEDMGGDLNLSLHEDSLDAAPASADLSLDSGDLDISGLMEGGMMEGLEAPAEEPVEEHSLDPAELLGQIADGPAPAEAAAQPSHTSLLDGLTLGDVSIGAAAAAVVAAQPEPAPAATQGQPVPVAALQDLQEKLAALATQVMGGSVAVVRLEGQLAEKDQALAAMEQRLQSSHDEAHSLRRELSDLRAQLEESLRQRAQDSDKAATEIKERLALVEDRQIQIDRDVRTEIERAVPREAARVIREEIAALAASMHEE